jgi:glycosyltransferase involved in cell wall biosynthesis
LIEVGHSTKYKNGLVGLVSTFLNRGLDLFLPVSKAVANSSRSKWAKKIQVCYHGIDIDAIKTWEATHKDQIEAERQAMSMSLPDPLRIIYVGRLDEQKGVLNLIPIMERLKDQPVTLTVVGGGELIDKVESAIRDSKLAGRVAMYGPRSDAWKFMFSADLMLAPSEFEGLGVVFMESMATGLPVLASDIPSIREIVVDGGTGLLVKIGDHEKFAMRISELLNDRTSLRMMAHNSLSKSELWNNRSSEENFYQLMLAAMESKGKR